ncbi:MAG: 2-oxoacid:acceptor oxidoreductase subunit alpha [Desulfobacteraceae bacterium]|nr:2-oxoacid:acceptor oxidoreductase subunit alpha [Desulfobacteraceae bacterium]
MGGKDLTIEICGMSGDGTIAAGQLLNAALVNAGYSLLAFDSYPAEIRGFGRCVTHSRVGSGKMIALKNKAHVLISLDDQESVSRIPFLDTDAVVLFDNKPMAFLAENQSIAAHVEPEAKLIGVPFGDLSAGATGSRQGRNLVALGAFAGLFGVLPEFFNKAIEKKFSSKGKPVVDSNLACFQVGYQHVLEFYKEDISGDLGEASVHENKDSFLISGNEAIAMGALDANVHFYFGYPITPATPVMEILAEKLPKRGGKVMQMEDEIASIGAVIGSFFAGKRAMTATSGPGFALMTELIAHATVTETPAVIVNAQRGGPGTGLPTKTEQSDLQVAVYGGPGDSARIVWAPTDVQECYEFTLRSFQIAEKYQTPVILLTDFFLHNRVESLEKLSSAAEMISDGNLYPAEEKINAYKRYEITETGISPRALPGSEGFIFSATGLEHTEKGRPDYSSAIHMQMSEKRHRKIRGALSDLPPPVEYAPKGQLDLGIIAWGSTFGAALEAVTQEQEQGKRIGALKITSIFPFHEEVISAFMAKCREVLIPELNFEGQLANLIGHLHGKKVKRLNQVTGTPLTPWDIGEAIHSILKVLD